MDFQVEQQGDCILCICGGRLDSTNAAEFEKLLLSAIADNRKKLILDFSNVEFLTSMALRVLLIAAKMLDRSSVGKMTVRNASPEVLNVLRLSGFDAFLNLEEA